MRSLHALSLSLAITATSSAFAQGADGDSRARAEKLFEEASGLLAKRDFAAACPKFEEVVKLQPQGIGANLTLADCYVGEGKLASAYAVLTRAADLATRAGQEDRANTARERLQSLEPRLSKMLIEVPQDIVGLPGLSVLRNGVPLTLADLNTAVLVDRGAYGIVVTAPGRKRFEKILTINDEGTSLTATVTLPLEQVQAPIPFSPPEPPPEAPPGSPWSAPRIAGMVMGIAGLGMVGAGIGVGMDGVSRMDVAAAAYGTGLENKDEIQKAGALKEHAGGQEEATAGWVVLGVGGAVTVAGVILAIAAPSNTADAPAQARIAPWVSSESFGTSLNGQW